MKNQQVAKPIKKQTYQEVDTLLQRRVNEAPKPGEYLFDYKLEALKKDIENWTNEEIQKKVKIKFSDLPLSKYTIQGLTKRNFKVMTEIQRCVLPHALNNRDILGASKTGSGKTLSYLIPVLEKLYVDKFNPLDGLGALIILPTRELALQVFEVISSIGQAHPHISMGLIIGGKNVKYEQENINRMNILIATPGRLLQHMDESPGFEYLNLKILVIDEVDMLLEMGFSNTLDAILANLPNERQTLLFSATLNKNIHDLAKLSLKKPEYISLHEEKAKPEKGEKGEKGPRPLQFELPKGLLQYYMVIKLEEKMDTLFSFLRSHTKTKCLVFFSSIKQVRFAYEAFKKLNLHRNLPLFELHGKQKQPQRMAIFFGYKEKKYACMFTTNIAARGLDFPAVDWVIQVDCPEDVATYVHRVGRTARYKSDGKSLLMLVPSEEKFSTKIKTKGITMNRIFPNPNKALTIKASLQSFVTEDPDLKHLAQKAFISYMRSIYLMSDKEIFNVEKLDGANFAESLGLINTPVIKFLTREEVEEEEPAQKDDESDDDNKQNDAPKQKKSKLAKLKEKIKAKRLQKMKLEGNAEEENDLEDEEESEEEKPLKKKSSKDQGFNKIDDEDDDDDFLKIKRRGEEIEIDDDESKKFKISKRQLGKIRFDGVFNGKNKVKFDEEGNALTTDEIKKANIKKIIEEGETRTDEPIQDYMRRKIMNEVSDKKREKMRVKEKKLKKKIKIKEERRQQSGQGAVAVLGNPDEDGDDGEEYEDDYESGDEENDDEDE